LLKNAQTLDGHQFTGSVPNMRQLTKSFTKEYGAEVTASTSTACSLMAPPSRPAEADRLRVTRFF
jgi:BRCT domain type II-containing protein